MLKINLLTFLRHFKKNKTISLINVFGLTIGLTTAVLSIYFSYHELTYESYHQKADQIYRVYTIGNFGSIDKIPTTFSQVGTDLTSYPEINKTARTRTLSAIGFLQDQPIKENNVMLVDLSAFSMFNFEIIKGTQPTGPSHVLLAAKTAEKYFGRDNPVGKPLTLKINGTKYHFDVSGVFKDFPSNTHLKKTSIIIPLEFARTLNWDINDYQSTSYGVYALTNPGTNYKALNQKIAATMNIPVQIEDIRIILEPIKRIYLYENIQENAAVNLVMLLIGGFIALFISCFNYINLNTILFTTRGQEVGIRKSFGASRWSIFYQFLSNTFFNTLISFLLALVIFYYLLPHFNTIFETEISLIPDGNVLLLLLAVFLFTVLLSGFYPSLILSRVQPATLLKSNTSQGPGRNRAVNFLISVQFVVAIILLQFLLISEKQNQHMMSENITGFNGENILCINGYPWGDLNSVKNELLQVSGIEKVSWGNTIPSVGLSMTPDWKEEGNKEMVCRIWAEADYLDIFEIELLEGTFFKPVNQSQDLKQVVINPLTAQSLGYEQPIGKTMMIEDQNYEIIGLVNNYQAVPPIFQDMPLIINTSGPQNEYLLIKIQPMEQDHTIQQVKQVLTKFNREQPIDLSFYQEHTQELAKSFYATAIIADAFTIIIIFNAMMGLFGLSFFMSEKKNKEIGIRKVCGASIPQIIWKLMKKFIRLLLIAFTLATPISYLLSYGFISNFARKIEITPGYFIAGGLLAFLMLVVSAGWKIWEAARRNPVQALSYE